MYVTRHLGRYPKDTVESFCSSASHTHTHLSMLIMAAESQVRWHFHAIRLCQEPLHGSASTFCVSKHGMPDNCEACCTTAAAGIFMIWHYSPFPGVITTVVLTSKLNSWNPVFLELGLPFSGSV